MQFSSALKRTMYYFKNSSFPNFLLIHRARYIFSRDMICLYHFKAKIYDVKETINILVLRIIKIPILKTCLNHWTQAGLELKSTYANKHGNATLIMLYLTLSTLYLTSRHIKVGSQHLLITKFVTNFVVSSLYLEVFPAELTLLGPTYLLKI